MNDYFNHPFFKVNNDDNYEKQINELKQNNNYYLKEINDFKQNNNNYIKETNELKQNNNIYEIKIKNLEEYIKHIISIIDNLNEEYLKFNK